MTAHRDAPLFVETRGRSLLAVAPMRHIERVIADTGATHLVSVLNAHLLPATPAAIDPARHLKLAVSDHVAEDGGSRHPLADSLEKLIAFAGRWDRETPLLVHCFSGLNRSTAAVYILLCAMNPNTPETLIAHHLRQSSDTAAPNRIMVAVADQLLGRGGRMAVALDSIGSGSPAAEGQPFLLSTIFDEPQPAARPPDRHMQTDIAPE